MNAIQEREHDFSFPSSNGLYTIYGKYYPADEPKAVVQILHGMSEHIGRYLDLISFLVAAGYSVVLHDHAGHGDSVNVEEDLGYIADKNGDQVLVDDAIKVTELAQKTWPSLPVILFGHSMGSFVARLTAAANPTGYAALILSGTAGPNSAVSAGLALCKTLRKTKGGHACSPMLDAMAFGSYLARTEKRTKYDWISSLDQEIDAYIEDPLCGFDFTISGMETLFTLLKRCNEKEAFANPENKMPILLYAGTEDPVGAYTKGVNEVARRYLRSGKTRVDVRFYPGARHETHNDTCRMTVYTDLTDWIGGVL